MYKMLEYRAFVGVSAAMMVRIKLDIGDNFTWRVSKTYLLVNERRHEKSSLPNLGFSVDSQGSIHT